MFFHRRTSTLLALALLVIWVPANAQNPEKHVNISLGAGPTWALSDAKDFFGNGFNFNIGAEFPLSRMIAIEGLYGFNGLGTRDFSLPVSTIPGTVGVATPFTADMNMQYGTGSVVVSSPRAARVRPYGLTGVGIYYRPVTITTPGVGFVPGFCNPWWFYCQPGGFVPVDNVVASHSSTDFGMVFGGGVNLKATEAASVFVEFRYHYIWGPQINPGAALTLNNTNTVRANGQFLPLTFGVRF
jgi:opacity protein-like surface antigen